MRDREDSTSVNSLPSIVCASLTVQTNDGKTTVMDIPTGNRITIASEMNYRIDTQLVDPENLLDPLKDDSNKVFHQKLKITIDVRSENSKFVSPSPLVVIRDQG